MARFLKRVQVANKKISECAPTIRINARWSAEDVLAYIASQWMW